MRALSIQALFATLTLTFCLRLSADEKSLVWKSNAAAVTTSEIEAAARAKSMVWKSKDFNYFDDALEFLNKLSDDQRPKGYILALSSARSGLFSGSYTVIYPTHEP